MFLGCKIILNSLSLKIPNGHFFSHIPRSDQWSPLHVVISVQTKQNKYSYCISITFIAFIRNEFYYQILIVSIAWCMKRPISENRAYKWFKCRTNLLSNVIT